MFTGPDDFTLLLPICLIFAKTVSSELNESSTLTRNTDLI